MDWNEWIVGLVGSLGMLRRGLGARATSPGPASDLGKRQTVFEHDAVMLVRERMRWWFPQAVRLEAEGYKPVGSEDAGWIVGFDPTDGTAGDARSADAWVKEGLPVSAVVAVRRNVPNSTFGSVEYAGILDLRHGEIFVAGPKGAFELLADGERQILRPKVQYNNHCPTLAWEIARRANSFLRFLVPYGIYPEMYSDSNSSALVMLWAVRGYCDAWLNFNLPGITGAGQRGHELGAIAVFARAMGACAVQTRVEGNQVVIVGPLDEAPYTFDGQTSCVIGVDQKIVDHYLALINAGLTREIKFERDGVSMSVGEVLAELYRQYPNERWGLPLVP